MSGIAHLFVRAYCTKMHGDCLRFQAQYLRRIRLPHWDSIASADQRSLSKRDATAVLDTVCCIYRMTDADRDHLTADSK